MEGKKIHTMSVLLTAPATSVTLCSASGCSWMERESRARKQRFRRMVVERKQERAKDRVHWRRWRRDYYHVWSSGTANLLCLGRTSRCTSDQCSYDPIVSAGTPGIVVDMSSN